jgi:hypothetical protein
MREEWAGRVSIQNRYVIVGKPISMMIHLKDRVRNLNALFLMLHPSLSLVFFISGDGVETTGYKLRIRFWEQ